jgi:hypothetical protein
MKNVIISINMTIATALAVIVFNANLPFPAFLFSTWGMGSAGAIAVIQFSEDDD